jgi:hypothetical protein
VFVNGTRLDESVLGPGDRVHFGSVEFVVTSVDAPADATIEREVTRVAVTATSVDVDQVTLKALLDTSRELTRPDTRSA